mgnify:FL=1
MKSKKKYFTKAKIIFVIFTIVFFGGYLLLANSVGNYDSMRTLKQLFPQEFKEFVKKKIFF